MHGTYLYMTPKLVNQMRPFLKGLRNKKSREGLPLPNRNPPRHPDLNEWEQRLTQEKNVNSHSYRDIRNPNYGHPSGYQKNNERTKDWSNQSNYKSFRPYIQPHHYHHHKNIANDGNDRDKLKDKKAHQHEDWKSNARETLASTPERDVRQRKELSNPPIFDCPTGVNTSQHRQQPNFEKHSNDSHLMGNTHSIHQRSDQPKKKNKRQHKSSKDKKKQNQKPTASDHNAIEHQQGTCTFFVFFFFLFLILTKMNTYIFHRTVKKHEITQSKF
ncbi:hypothetical protein RFI_18390 [Reticulomyxa filosa]|uniref:Uncharacterized protein n=1 Tax=Reticulomyxa filosa TaxID=46433 RepID=X6MZD6_RETFI|nr:hypothetical protein RFI_18390 [Reticulomyxa filosa]|eukprot:ETO18854.1 hypothetical protein RFI_18390 [Reticulomyxa filosa]